MKWLKSISSITQKVTNPSKKRTQEEAASSSIDEVTDTGELVTPQSEGEEEFNSRPKRRSVDVQKRASIDRRTSLDKWHEARRLRNSLDGEATVTTDRLTLCKAGSTTIVNKTYVTIKHLGSGTFGRVMLCFNVYDQRLYAIKVCRKSQFVQNFTRHSQNSRLRRNSHHLSYGSLPSPGGSAAAAAPPPPPPPQVGQTCNPLASGGGAVALPAAGARSSCGIAAVPGFGNTSSCNLQVQCNGGALSPPPIQCGQQACGAPPAAANIIAASGSAAFGMQPNGSLGLFGQAAVPTPPPAAAFGNTSSSANGLLGVGAGAFPRPAPWDLFGTGGKRTPSFNEQQQQLFLQQQQQQQMSILGSGGANTYSGQLPPVPMATGGAGAAAAGIASNPMNSAGSSTVYGLGTDCSTGSQGGGSVFQEVLMRYQTEEMVKEIAILKKLSHANIVNLVEIIDDPSTDSLLLVMEYVEGGTLEPPPVGRAEWQPLREQDIWQYVREVLQGLDYLHYNKVVHGDLKPANLLRDSNSKKVKIADFGSSMMAGSDKLFSMRNSPGFSTPAFRSPESLLSGYQPSYEMDMWALGVCVYMWVYGKLPFRGSAPFVIYEKIRTQEVHPPSRPEVSPELQDFILQLLDKDVLKRLDVVAAMQHPWVTLNGTAPLKSQRDQQFAASVGLTGPCSSGGAGGAMRPELCGVGGVSCRGVTLTQEDIKTAVRRMDGGVGQLMDVVFMEHHYQDGQTIIAAGDIADKIYLIARGQVEIRQAVGDRGGPEPLITGVEMDFPECQDGDVFDHSLPDLSSSPTGLTSMMLLGDVLPPHVSSPCGEGAWGPPNGTVEGGSSSSTPTTRLVAIKGPGDSLGLPTKVGSMLGGREYHWQVTVKARGELVLFVAKVSDLARLVEVHPEMEQAVKQIVTQQETDMMVTEAMRQLQLFNGYSHHPPQPRVACEG